MSIYQCLDHIDRNLKEPAAPGLNLFKYIFGQTNIAKMLSQDEKEFLIHLRNMLVTRARDDNYLDLDTEIRFIEDNLK